MVRETEIKPVRSDFNHKDISGKTILERGGGRKQKHKITENSYIHVYIGRTERVAKLAVLDKFIIYIDRY